VGRLVQRAHVDAVPGKLGVRDRVPATIAAYDLGTGDP